MPSQEQTTWAFEASQDGRWERSVATIPGVQLAPSTPGAELTRQPWTPIRSALPAPSKVPSRYGLLSRTLLADPDLTAADKLVLAYLRGLRYAETEREIRKETLALSRSKRPAHRGELDVGGRKRRHAELACEPFSFGSQRIIAERIGLSMRTVGRSLGRLRERKLASSGRCVALLSEAAVAAGQAIKIPWVLTVEQPNLAMVPFMGVFPMPTPKATHSSHGYLSRFTIGLASCSQLTPLARLAYAESRSWAEGAKRSEDAGLRLDFRRMERWAQALGCSRSSIAAAQLELERVGLLLVERKHRRTHTRCPMAWEPCGYRFAGFSDAELQAFRALPPRPVAVQPKVSRPPRFARAGTAHATEQNPGHSSASPTPNLRSEVGQIASPIGSPISASQRKELEPKMMSESACAGASASVTPTLGRPGPSGPTRREWARAQLEASPTATGAPDAMQAAQAAALVGQAWWASEGRDLWAQVGAAQRAAWLAEAPRLDATDRRLKLTEARYASEAGAG